MKVAEMFIHIITAYSHVHFHINKDQIFTGTTDCRTQLNIVTANAFLTSRNLQISLLCFIVRASNHNVSTFVLFKSILLNTGRSLLQQGDFSFNDGSSTVYNVSLSCNTLYNYGATFETSADP